MVDPDDTEVFTIVNNALEQLADLDLDPADACGTLAIGALVELADLGDVQAALGVYRTALEHLLGELTRLQAATQVRH
jgi:hypothetical protein